jgi:hypothetical protein
LSGRFCHGESPTVADICLVTQATPAMTFKLSLDPYPRVMRIYETCMAIPAFADAHPGKQPEEDPSYPHPYRCLAACYAHMGRLDDARELVGRRGWTAAA